MGLIRGALHIATYGGVSPKSKKQRMASMQLAATQGKSETEIKIAGSRNFDWVNQASIRARQQRELRARQQAGLAGGSPDWRPEARDDGGGDCRAGQDLMATCHGVRMARVASNTRGLSREPLVGPLQDFANRTSTREHK